MGQSLEVFDWKDKLKAAALAFPTGIALRVNPLDPLPSLVDLAIARAPEVE